MAHKWAVVGLPQRGRGGWHRPMLKTARSERRARQFQERLANVGWANLTVMTIDEAGDSDKAESYYRELLRFAESMSPLDCPLD